MLRLVRTQNGVYMQLGIKVKLIFKILFLTLFILGAKLSFADVYNSSTCTYSGGLVSDANPCFTAATAVEYPVLKVALCTAKPTAPSLTTAIDISKCTVLVNNTTGNTTTVRKSGSTKFPGTLTSLATMSGGTSKGTSYTYVYIESSAYTSLKATAKFTSSKTAVDGSSGTTCWTTTQSIYSFGPVPTSGASCGSTASEGWVTVYLNSLGTNAAYMNYTSTYGSITTDTYLVDSSLRQAAATTSGSMGTVSKVITVQTLPITITNKSGGIKALLDMSNSAWILWYSNANTNLWFQSGGASLLLYDCGERRCSYD